jgi:hypothetical protein
LNNVPLWPSAEALGYCQGTGETELFLVSARVILGTEKMDKEVASLGVMNEK